MAVPETSTSFTTLFISPFLLVTKLSYIHGSREVGNINMDFKEIYGESVQAEITFSFIMNKKLYGLWFIPDLDTNGCPRNFYQFYYTFYFTLFTRT